MAGITGLRSWTIPASLVLSALFLPITPATAGEIKIFPGPEGITPAVSAGHIRIEPQEVPINLFYKGAVLKVEAIEPWEGRAVLLLEGEDGPLDLKTKGKVWGFLWMNVGDASFDAVPTVYLAATTTPPDSASSRELLSGLGLDYDALARRAGGDTTSFRELIKLKEKEGLYSLAAARLQAQPAGVDSVRLSASLHLSAKTPAGEYAVRLFVLRDGKILSVPPARLQLKQAGLAQSLHEMAMHRGLLYGCVAVIIALVAGLATGLIFGKGAGKGH